MSTAAYALVSERKLELILEQQTIELLVAGNTVTLQVALPDYVGLLQYIMLSSNLEPPDALIDDEECLCLPLGLVEIASIAAKPRTVLDGSRFAKINGRIETVYFLRPGSPYSELHSDVYLKDAVPAS